MKTITKKINIYNFNELKENIKEKLIEKEKRNMQEDYCDYVLQCDMESEAERLLQKYFKNKATLKNVYYSLGYCQGDGAMLEFDVEYYGKLLEVRHYGYYCNEKSFIINNVELITENQEGKIKEKIFKMNRELTKCGYALIEYEYSNNEIIEKLEEHNYLEDGTIYE